MRVPNSLQAYYAARAREYESVYFKSERQADLRLIEQWLPSRFSGRNVLDVACGTGYWTRFIASSASLVVGVDAAVETLEIARARMTEGRSSFVLGDAYALPVRQRAFGGVFAGFWFSHVPKSRRREFLEGIARAAEPGAAIVLLDNRYVPGSSTPVSAQDGEGDTFQVRTLSDGTKHLVLKNFPEERELRICADGLGSEGVFHLWEYYWAFEYVAARR